MSAAEQVIATARICNRKGLHARAAAKVVKTASEFDARLSLHHAGQSAGATSILSLLMLAADMGSEVELHGEGPQSQQAVDAVCALIARRFDETE